MTYIAKINNYDLASGRGAGHRMGYKNSGSFGNAPIITFETI